MPLSGVESLLAQGRYLQADRETERLIASGELGIQNLAEAYVKLSIAKQHLQDFFAGAKVAERALAIPEATPDTQGMACFMAGVHYANIGDTHLTIQHNEQFLNYVDASERCKRQEPNAHFNMAVAYRQRREYSFAIGHYEMAARIYTETGRISRAMLCHRDIAWCYMTIGDTDRALPFLKRIEEWVAETENPEFRVFAIVDKAMYHFSTGQYSKALAHCEEVFAPGRSDVTPDNLTEACWIAGECALAGGQLHEANIFANLTLDHALKAKWPFMMNRGSDLRRRVNEARRRMETAS